MTPYEMLGVPNDATLEQIKAAWKIKARKLHPDAGGDPNDFKKAEEAFEMLKKWVGFLKDKVEEAQKQRERERQEAERRQREEERKRQKEREREEELQKQKAQEREEAERRQREIEEALRLQKERELREAERQREQQEAFRKKPEIERAEKAKAQVSTLAEPESSSAVKPGGDLVLGMVLLGIVFFGVIVAGIVDAMNSSPPAKKRVASKANSEFNIRQGELSKSRGNAEDRKPSQEAASENEIVRPLQKTTDDTTKNSDDTIASDTSLSMLDRPKFRPSVKKLIQGKVLNTNGLDLEISLGSKDGLSVNDELEVFRDLNGRYVRFLGRIKLVSVTEDRSVGMVQSPNTYIKIRLGDDVLFQTR